MKNRALEKLHGLISVSIDLCVYTNNDVYLDEVELISNLAFNQSSNAISTLIERLEIFLFCLIY
ncbi:MAG: hypothetical protein IKO56_04070 [Alphaproteobacteria bacterium]|nr:hypothetical protein [Alphaproteobacteria bacterium]